MIHEVWRTLVLRHIRVEQLSSLRQELAMILEIVVPVKHGMSALMLALMKAETKAEAIPVHMQQGHTHQRLQGVFWHCMLGIHAQYTELTFIDQKWIS